MISDKIFIEDPMVLINPSRMIEFYPSKDMTLAEKTNALARLALYTGIAVSIYHGNPKGIQNALIAIAVLIVLWKNQSVEKLIDTTTAVIGTISRDRNPNGIYEDGPLGTLGAPPESRVIVENAPCRMPTKENPFMNRSATDPMDSMIPACKGPGVDQLAEELLNSQLMQDPTDIFGKKAMQRSFYTVPEEDREKFANWLFKDAANCKEEPEHCAQQPDLRWRRDISEEIDPELLYQ